ncbi:MAG: iron-containing alcohol dehydrogenase family protein [Bacillota bacterium]
MEWVYTQPVKIYFGSRKITALNKILKELNLKNGLLVSDPFFVSSGLAGDIVDYSKGLLIDVFSEITPNPTVDNVDSCVKLINDKKIEFIAALGGGSAIDCAKAAAGICTTLHPTTDYLIGKRKLGKDHLPLIAIPSTAGTGSEVTCVSVLSDPHRGIKAPLASESFYPSYAIIDPALTLSMPKHITASTGFDVLSHALEGFWSKNHQPICDALALHASKLVFDNLLIAYEDGGNLSAREKMSEASVTAGLAFSLPMTAGVHACSYPLTNIYGMPHGEACAFVLDKFVEINADVENGRLHRFACQLGFFDAYEMSAKILEMKNQTCMKINLADAGIDSSEIENLAVLSMHPDILNNPVKMTIDKLIEMYRGLE